MTGESLDCLLEKLGAGDFQAAEEVFVTYEPYLRKVVRRHLTGRHRAKFDSIDVVQSVMADVMRGFRKAGWRFQGPAQLRAFLLKVTRNRLVDRCRHHHTALEREQSLEISTQGRQSASRQPAPSEVAQADDLWRKMLKLCPASYHELLRLKRQGLSLQEIGQRIGLHEDSVRRILRKLARQLALDQRPLPPAAPA